MQASRFAIFACSVAFVMLSGCSGSPATSDNPEGDQNATVSIEDFKFNPGTRNIHKGSTVTWTNDGDQVHTATAHSHSGGLLFDSGDIAAGKSWSHTFDHVGSFTYHCDRHHAMSGTITVTE